MKPARRQKDARIDVRVSGAVKRRLTRAAQILDQPLSDFMLASAEARATDLLRESEIIRLTQEEGERFVTALEKGPSPNKTLRDAFEKYRSAITQGRLVSR